MPILCLEGPSAVGKSSTAQYLAEHHEAIHIPEVNLLFERPSDPNPFWYYERQVERFQMARAYREEKLVILDGDPFQPVWYNALFPLVSRVSYPLVLEFYRSHLMQKTLAWPDGYLILGVPVAELRKRNETDHRFRRRNFEAHLALVDLLPTYFERLPKELVTFQEAETVVGNATAMLQWSQKTTKQSDAVAIFDEITAWVKMRL